MILIYLVPFLGLLSSFTPCMWNLSLLFRAYAKKGGYTFYISFFLSRLLLFNVIALLLYITSLNFSLDKHKLMVVQGFVASIFILGFPLMRRFGFAPFDLSFQFLFPNVRFPEGLALGFNLPYCALPFILLLGAYSLYLSTPFLIFNLYFLFSALPMFFTSLLPERVLKGVAPFIRVVPVATGIILILSLVYFINVEPLLLQVRINNSPFLFLVMFLLGIITSFPPLEPIFFLTFLTPSFLVFSFPSF